ncbi:hypothetical protein [Desulfuromonas thiophila]|uniref:hypothetical protein n=1 Tax=Desulfuromonas thiophila TaxID=57664 RepID=UPI000B813BB9|nr:hypothetical protein [Desulfuromonas thiophila]
MTVNEISCWIDSHQLLVVSIIIPLVSAAVAFLSSWYSTRRALKTEREKLDFQAKIKVAEFRQNWINQLRDSMSEFQSYGVLPNADPSQERDFYRLGTKIELLMNPNDPDYGKIQQCLYAFLHAANGNMVEKYGVNSEFISTCQGILKREWERLKADLKQQ